MTNHARSERLALCTTLTRVGPQSPTLCEGWAARDLAAHLVVREHRPDVQVAQLVAPLAGRAVSAMERVAQRPFAELVATLRSGPPRWHPTRVQAVDELVNTAEFFVHHEDVLRGQASWTARPLPDDLEESLWRACSTLGRVALRRTPVGVELVAPGHGRVMARKGSPVVLVEGSPGELLLFAFGRRGAAQVQLDGPEAAVQKLQSSPAGL